MKGYETNLFYVYLWSYETSNTYELNCNVILKIS